jgi:hypothetical protein
MHCLQLIREVGIKKVMYSDGDLYSVKYEYARDMTTEWVSRGNLTLQIPRPSL